MQNQPVHQCQCPECQRPDANPVKALHTQMNFFLSTLDEHQRRLYVGLESQKLGHGGDRRLATITGVSVDTIAKGRGELQRPTASEGIRASGGGRFRAEKKTRRS